MMHWWWCGICERVAVPRSGDTCVRCAAAIAEICNPNDRIDGAWRRRRPLGVRLLHWFTGLRDTPAP